jgi:hypothetical protein
MTVATAVELYRHRNGSYPASIDDAIVRSQLPNGKFPYVAPGPNGECSTPLAYRVGSAHGKPNDAYVLSTCVELASNAAGAFDKTRYERHVNDTLDTLWQPEQKIPNEKPAADPMTIRTYTPAGNRDAARKTAAMNVVMGLEVYYNDNGTYPTDPANDEALKRLFKGGKLPTGPDYPQGGFCSSTFTYQPATATNGGVENYRLVVCLEDPKGAGADQDGGTDANRYEIYGETPKAGTTWGAEKTIQ